MMTTQSTQELDKVTGALNSIDFGAFSEYYKAKRTSRIEENLSEGLETEPVPLGNFDDVLHSALEVAQELLSDATSAAMVRAEHTLSLRLRTLLKSHTDSQELEDGPLSTRCTAGPMGPQMGSGNQPQVNGSAEDAFAGHDPCRTLSFPEPKRKAVVPV
ncbi:unnamed protein product [Effrenium voratum]|nr:unnamed protein product [Effrenium voratum]